MSAEDSIPTARPQSDVSSAVGLVGLAGLFAWVAFARAYPQFADALNLPGPRAPMAGPHAALVGLVAAALPMALWSTLVDKVHRRPSTGLDWSLARARNAEHGITLTKLAGIWATWAILAALYCLCRWYWSGNYVFAINVLAWASIPIIVLSIPYLFWIDRYLVNRRDHAWHFGAMVLLREGWDVAQVKAHWRTWIIKGFFTAFMISIIPFAFRNVVEAELSVIAHSPEKMALIAIEAMFMIDVMIGTVGYIVTMRPLDAHIRSGNPFLGGWVAALICYPPFVWGILGDGRAINYEFDAPGWTHWFAGNDVALAGWGAGLVLLTGFYAWATFAFGLRFSNLTYRGVLTNGPYRFTRHPAYVSKNLFWWFATLPFLVSSGSEVEAIRNCFFLLVVNGIYFWRAKTEEAHLLSEDAKYREYHAWMAGHGAITAPLTRLFGWLDPRRRLGLQSAG
ncbi:methyltransferase family protein [Qipengyuania zhejiangensis]|uniref:methyltransferase family protein n=1 Tax=Qipengyuania zhejiangensis TaxID=3077782 RepID=UPI002D774CB5|nr:isoprenylcysteine carboxylmethyltransferase family protein [Qipengyuania sp. Z2]